MNVIFWKLSYLSERKIKILWENYGSLIFKSNGNGDLYWTNVETNNLCQIHWIQLLQFYIEISLMQKIEKFFWFLHFPWLFKSICINLKHVNYKCIQILWILFLYFSWLFKFIRIKFKVCKVINVYKFFEFY